MQLPTIEEYIADLKRRMEADDITGTAIAEEMGIHASAFSRWLTLKVEPRLSTIAEIEAAVTAILAKRLV
jgi:predicted transcriptional regulator